MSAIDDDAASRPDDENPEWMRDDVKKARPALAVIEGMFGADAAETLRRRPGRPRKLDRKVNQTLRLDAEVIKAYRRRRGLADAHERGSTRAYAGTWEIGGYGRSLNRILREIEGPLIGVALAVTQSNQIRAVEVLGVKRNTLRKKVRTLDLQNFSDHAMRTTENRT